jgi:hypothetical protein
MDTEALVAGIVATFLGGLLLLAVPWVRRKLGRLGQWLARQVAAAKESEQQVEAERIQVLREQVVDVARANGATLPVRSKGRNPAVVKYSDGGTSWYYADWESYRRAIADLTVNPTRTFRQDPPLPVERWDRARLEEWLSDPPRGPSSP